MAKETEEAAEDSNIIYVLTYLFSIVSGLVVYFVIIPGYGGTQKNKRLKKHAMQAIVLGVILIIASVALFFVPIVRGALEVLIWLYGLYVGYEASNGVEVDIPYVTAYATLMAR